MNQIRTVLLIIAIMLLPKNLFSSPGTATIIFSNYDLENTVFLSRLTVQQIFTRRITRWVNGDNITVFIKPMESIEHRNFVNNVLNMSLYTYQKKLEAYTQATRALPVIEVSSDQKMLNAIHKHPGAIGYVNYELFIDDKIIKVCDDRAGCY